MACRYGRMAAAIALAAACLPDLAVAEWKRDFLARPWSGYAFFDSENSHVLGCVAGAEGDGKPALAWTRWADRDDVEINVHHSPWTFREGGEFRVALSVDDAWSATATARLSPESGDSKARVFEIVGEAAGALPEAAAKGRKLKVERAGETPLSFSLSGVGRMLESLDRCRRRLVTLQKWTNEIGLRAADFFVAQEDARSFARWSDKLSRFAHAGVTLVGLGDDICRAVDGLSSGGYAARIAKFVLGLAVAPASEVLAEIQKDFAELEAFEPASGDSGTGVVLRAATGRLLVHGETVNRAVKKLLSAISQDDDAESARLCAAISRYSHLGYVGDNVYLTIRNASRSEEEFEYHLNQASWHINKMIARLVKKLPSLSDDALAAQLPALIAASRDRILNARRWSVSGRQVLAGGIADAMFRDESQASPERMALFEAYERSMQAEDALADRFEGILDEVEAALRDGAPLSETKYLSLVHGGQGSSAVLLQDRFTRRIERGAAQETFEDR